MIDNIISYDLWYIPMLEKIREIGTNFSKDVF